jgi:GNAT superfamily N-acetyltransferase
MAPMVTIRPTTPDDFTAIREISLAVYPDVPPWDPRHLASHLAVFPQGQLVALLDDRVVGMAASLIIAWDDYDLDMAWRDFTNEGLFTNHDPAGRTLYGAEIMVHPSVQGHGVGSRLYEARRALARRLRLLRIRAGARLRGYSRYAARMTADQYVVEVTQGRLTDPTLSFQLHQGFEVLAVVSGYLRHDPESLGYAALIEWINDEVARPEDIAGRPARYVRLSS